MAGLSVGILDTLIAKGRSPYASVADRGTGTSAQAIQTLHEQGLAHIKNRFQQVTQGGDMPPQRPVESGIGGRIARKVDSSTPQATRLLSIQPAGLGSNLDITG